MKTDNEENKLIIEKTQEAPKTKMASYGSLFRYATKDDKILIVVGGIASLINGAALPLFSVIFGMMTNSFAGEDTEEMLKSASEAASYFCYVAVGSFILSFIMFSSFIISGERQSIQLRKEYFAAILRQEVGWFDSINPNELNTKVADESYAVQGAIQEKLGTFILTFSTFVCGFIIGYIYGWQLALVITACMPVLATSIIVVTTVVMKSMKATQDSYSLAAAESEQALNAIKTVKTLDGEDFECERYTALLNHAAQVTIKFSFFNGLAFGFIFGAMIWTYALGFWYGAKLISEETYNSNMDDIYTAGDVMTIFFSILMGSFSLGQAGPCFQAFGKGQIAGQSAFEIIDRKPKIEISKNPIKLVNFNGEIKIENVEFSYPSRSSTKVLQKASLVIPPGKKVALVGESGCGKSTILQIIERFYDVDEGRVLIGEQQVDVKLLDLVQYRSQVGMVGQEPVLFATSIRENLYFGKTDATEEEMINALKKVNAWDFVSKMDKGLDTYVGMGGGQLSGGQKQRIAIARAILKQPKLLLLDEATSALDRTNEKLIQATLDEVSKGITTIVIAHRLSTIQNADLIYVFANGVVIEQGNHSQLIALGGKYAALAKNQIIEKPIKLSKKETAKVADNQQDDDQESLMESIQSINQFAVENENVVDKAIHEIKDITIIQKALTQDIPQVDQGIPDNVVMPRLFSYNKKEMPYFILGIISAAINGCIFPCFSLFFSEMITLLLKSNPKFYPDPIIRHQKQLQVSEDANLICLWFFLFGCGFLIFQSCENFFLSIVAENLTAKLRSDTFRKLLRMPIPYFDKPENNAGTLTARLSVDCKIVQNLTSTIIGFKIQNFAALVSGLAIAFSASWALTLLVIATAPISYFGKKLRTKYMGSFGKETDPAYKESGNLIMEAVTNIRTVFSFGNENIILNAYNQKVQAPLDSCKTNGAISGVAFGFAQMQMFLINAFIFYMGALLVNYYDLSVLDMFKAIFGITFATMGGSRDSHFVGDVDKGYAAAKNIFKILDSIDEYQIETETKCKKLTSKIQGNIEVKGITFKYPSREKNVFTNLSLQIPAGQKVSFVGPSGCGKSTVMQMLMRFYDPDDGQILLDGINIKDYDIRYLRRQLAIVSQEPVLFNGTITENIRYNFKDVTQNQIEEVTKRANAYDFIVNDQFEAGDNKDLQAGKGFNKSVGPKGAQISGGQKQRIAIARAILRDGSLLLLDEATSALDSQTEQLVQDSLNNFMKGKTTLTIAHRISTIKDSNIIYVFEDGQIVEQGTYQKLVSLRGYFYRLEQGIANEEKQLLH